MLIHSIWEMGFRPQDVKWIILSHGHVDHFGAAPFSGRCSELKSTWDNPTLKCFAQRQNNP